MNRKEKSEKKRIISEYIDLGNGRYKDSEVDSLHELATEPDKYNGKSKTIRNKFDGVSSDGKYTREEETTYTLRGDKEGVRIEKNISIMMMMDRRGKMRLFIIQDEIYLTCLSHS